MANHRAPERKMDVVTRDFFMVIRPARHVIWLIVLHTIATTLYYQVMPH